ncbi:MAG: L-rhamnose/proton symporter RhaT, partial [Planctomycetota bacterium]
LGYAVALGMCALFGTILPPIFNGEFGGVVSSTSGQVILFGLLVCIAGIAMSGKAGFNKERELSDEQKNASVPEFHFGLGLIVALFAGVMSACMAFGFAAGKPIAELATASGLPPIWQNLSVLIVILFGGFCMNFCWCGFLILRRKNLGVYWGQPANSATNDGSVDDTASTNWPINYLWCAIAGIVWYMQFFFYGMGTTQMGAYEFSSWTLHMASIIVFSTLWGIALREWQGTSKATHGWIAAGLLTLIVSTLIVGYGNYLAPAAAAAH